jgi:hypothetical protein
MHYKLDDQGSIPRSVGSGGLFAWCVRLRPHLHVMLWCLIEHRVSTGNFAALIQRLVGWLVGYGKAEKLLR